MKRLAIAVVGALALGAIGAGITFGQAQPHNGRITVKVTPKKHGTKKKPKNVTLFVDVGSDAPADPSQGYATSSTTIHFDKNLVFGGKYMKSCSKSQVLADYTKCPKGSKVGSGSATGTAVGATDHLQVLAFNGPGGNKIELWVNDNGTLKFTAVIEGTLSSDSGVYGKKLVVPIPSQLQQPVPGVYATLTDFQTTVKGTGSKRRPFVGLKGCPSDKALKFGADFTYTDGTSATPTTTAPCS
jgi:hypothetical protein